MSHPPSGLGKTPSLDGTGTGCSRTRPRNSTPGDNLPDWPAGHRLHLRLLASSFTLLSSLCSETARLHWAKRPLHQLLEPARGRPLPACGPWACPLPHQTLHPGSTPQAPGPWGCKAWARLCWDWRRGWAASPTPARMPCGLYER